MTWVLRDAANDRIALLVLPHAVLGGSQDGIDGGPRSTDLPPAVDLDGPELAELRRHARSTVVCLGVTERDGDRRVNTAICLTGDGVLGVHRQIHLDVGERDDYRAGTTATAFDTPVGRIGMLVGRDKVFPETARSLAVDGAILLAVPSVWPASRTATSSSLVRDRERRTFDLYDQARAAENQVAVVSANQTGRHGQLRFFGRSKVVRPDGDIAAVVGSRAGLAVAEFDLESEVAEARARRDHVAEHRARYGRGASPLVT